MNGELTMVKITKDEIQSRNPICLGSGYVACMRNNHTGNNHTVRAFLATVFLILTGCSGGGGAMSLTLRITTTRTIF